MPLKDRPIAAIALGVCLTVAMQNGADFERAQANIIAQLATAASIV